VIVYVTVCWFFCFGKCAALLNWMLYSSKSDYYRVDTYQDCARGTSYQRIIGSLLFIRCKTKI